MEQLLTRLMDDVTETSENLRAPGYGEKDIIDQGDNKQSNEKSERPIGWTIDSNTQSGGAEGQ